MPDTLPLNTALRLADGQSPGSLAGMILGIRQALDLDRLLRKRAKPPGNLVADLRRAGAVSHDSAEVAARRIERETSGWQDGVIGSTVQNGAERHRLPRCAADIGDRDISVGGGNPQRAVARAAVALAVGQTDDGN